VNRAFDQIKTVAGSARIVDPMFSVNWHFVAGKGELKSASIEEMADDQLVDAAYPDLAEGIVPFISRYLDSPESVLVVQGPPGTGKTRLIRAILGEISRRNGGGAQALYTGDKRALESDEIFVEFITGWDDAFVVEDADHLLKPRADGNENLHRFLTIADGVVRAQGRKIIFSTNLPNVGDLDDALIRPGRCFALVRARALNLDEAMHLLRVASRRPPGGICCLPAGAAYRANELHPR
jgi:SpoVK/Ycf46/Vps4 family AAA+-type ATPase